jgi:hypothetical protein
MTRKGTGGATNGHSSDLAGLRSGGPETEDPEQGAEGSGLDTTITIRVSGAEKALTGFLARREGLSVGRYLVALMRGHGQRAMPVVVADAKRIADRGRKVRRSRRKAIPQDLLDGFLVPFTRRDDALPFKRSIESAAEKAGVSAHSVAWVASHLCEAIAREVANGHVVRIPGLAVIGPWRIEARGICVPRFQASQAFVDYLLTDGERQGANRALQAHRRRRRQRLQNLPKAMASYRARVEAQHRRLLDGFEAWHAYGGGGGLV